MYHIHLAVQHIYEGSDGYENGDGKEGGEWRLPGLLYANDLVLCVKSEEDLRVMMGLFLEVCRRRVLKANVGDATGWRGGIIV